MRTGLQSGAVGADVAGLQQALATGGLAINPTEIAQSRFGASTLAALQAFQRANSLPVTASLTSSTVAALLGAAGVVPAGDGRVGGRLVDGDGAPVGQTVVVLYSVQVRARTELARATTAASGAYSIDYKRPQALNLQLEAHDANAKVLATSATQFNAGERLTLDLSTGADAVVRPLSRYAALSAAVAADLDKLALIDLQETPHSKELTFLASAIGADYDDVAGLYLAEALASRNSLLPATLFGLFAGNQPADLKSALADPPAAGFDATFQNQVLANLLVQTRQTLQRTLDHAVSLNVLPASFAASQSAQLDQLDKLRVAQTAAARYVRGKTPLSDVLGAGAASAGAQQAFIKAYADAGGKLGPTWKTLRADKSLSAEDIAALNAGLSAGELLAGNLPLVKDTLARLKAGSIKSLRDLATLSEADWETRIKAVDSDASAIPPVLPNESVADRITRCAKSLASRFASRYPTTAFAGALGAAATSSFRSKADMATFLQANPKLNLRYTNVDQYLVTNKLTVAPATLADLKTAQRLHRLSPRYATVEALHVAGYRSAADIYFAGRGPFVAHMTGPMGSANLAQMAFARAQMTYGTVLASVARFNGAFNQGVPSVVTPPPPSASTLANLPDLQALFGSFAFFQCDDCQSIYSPAAYLVDLLQYLAGFTAAPLPGAPAPFSGLANPRDALLARRPDIAHVVLDCANTNVTVPYIDLVNEVLEAGIAPPSVARPTAVATTGDSAERAALPEQQQPAVAAAAYAAAKAAKFPLSLPFDVDFARTQAYVAALGTSRAALIQLFPGQANPGAIAGAMLGLNDSARGIVNAADSVDPWTRWGLAQHPAQVIDPDTRAPLSPNPSDWVAALNHAPVLMNAAGLDLQQLYQLLEAQWVTQKTVTLSAGSTSEDGVTVLDPDPGALVFTGLTADVLDRANRFVRLWSAIGLEMWELDWALTQAPGGGLSDNILLYLAEAQSAQQQLGLAFGQAQVFWAPIQTRDVVSHLGDEDVVVPSDYSEVFGGPTMTINYPGLFAAPAALSGAQLVYPPPTGAGPGPTSAQLLPLSGVCAALGLSASDVAAILGASGAANTLTLDTLTTLLRYSRLAKALAVSVPDIILWITLTDASPFAGAPQNMLEFLRRLTLLQAPGVAVHDLDYLLRAQSTAQSSLVFTASQADALAQSVRDAIAKAAAGPLTVTGVKSVNPIQITTAKPHGLATGATVFISGVEGEAGANGRFQITVVGAADFTLDGAAPQGKWRGGGAIATDLDDAIAATVTAALVAASGAPAQVVDAALIETALLPLSVATIEQLIATPSVTAALFPTLAQAFGRVIKAGALFLSLTPPVGDFVFAIQKATAFGWLQPAGLPLQPVVPSPYAAFEALVRALALQKRQTSASPKPFDVLGQWTSPAAPPATTALAIAGVSLGVTAASDAAPIVIQTAAPHGLADGLQVTISGVQGNTAANGAFTIKVTAPDGFDLVGSRGNGAYVGGGTAVVLGLAAALNGAPGDVTTLVGQLGFKPPETGAACAGSLADPAALSDLAAALDVVARYGMGAQTLIELAGAVPSPDTANTASGVFQAQYPQTAWLAAVQPVENALRVARRDALIAYMLGNGAPASPGAAFVSVDDIFNYYLIDPEMGTGSVTTRLLQPSLAIQQFVQQCYMNLNVGVSVPMTDTSWQEWAWRCQYRLWQANREVFLYPENYVLPETRTTASPFFSDLENDLRQSNCDADAAEGGFETYLRKLVGVARLVVAALYNESRPDGSTVTHVFAHTRGTPAQWWYRNRMTLPPATGTWSAWTSLSLDIASEQVVPVIWDQRLFLFWPIFKQISQAQGEQEVPKQGGGSSPVPEKYWSIELAMSELSAGQWQSKRTYSQKIYIRTDNPTSCLTFRAFTDASMNLTIQVLINGVSKLVEGLEILIAQAVFSVPDAEPAVTQVALMTPAISSIDTAQETSFRLIATTSELYYQGASIVDPTPAQYCYAGQALTWGGWTTPSAQNVQLNVTAVTTNTAQTSTVEVLSRITNPRMIIPLQETSFDSMEPFFVADVNHTWFVQPHYFTISSNPTEFDDFRYVTQWSTRYQFETFYHPYARTLLRELEIGGVAQLMARKLQATPQQVRGLPTTFDFGALYVPTNAVLPPYPGAVGASDPGESFLDFDSAGGGAYSLYNWEVFYHGPMFVAALLLQNNQYKDALAWLNYIFDPTDSSNGAAPQRFWEMAPFNAMTSAQWNAEQIQNILTKLAADAQTGIGDPATQNAILAWMNDPYDPHMVAQTRISAYAKATVMRVLDTLIAWGDSLYAQYTSETVAQAEQYYIIAQMLLGPKPAALRVPSGQQQPAPTYAQLTNLDAFSNVLEPVENLIIAPEPPPSLISGSSPSPSLPQVLGQAQTLLFCIPPNAQLMAYWGTVDQRLANIRAGLNLQGQAQPLPLYAPPINPLALMGGQGGAGSGTLPVAPIYRFATYLHRAIELINDVRSYGGLILAALEKQDSEALAVLRATQELAIQTMTVDVRNRQVTEAQDQITVLQNQKAVTQLRYAYYSSRPFMNPAETAAITLQGAALVANGAAVILDMTAGAAHLVPSIMAGAAGFGGSPTVNASYGGENIGHSASSFSTVARGLAGIMTEAGGIAATMGGYQRRQDDWTYQASAAQADLAVIASQMTAADDRLGIARSELAIQNTHISNAQAVSDFLQSKYTNAQLYNWMVSQLTTVYAQAYQLGLSLAQQAQSAYQYELGRLNDVFIQAGYWDDQHKGLTAGESLMFDLRRMEAQFLANNVREQELTRHVSLALTQPAMLLQLLQTGNCQIALDESLFDSDHPGHYFRRLRSVAVTIPCVTGPYTGVNASLSLNQSVVRQTPPAAGFQPWIWATAGSNTDPAVAAPPQPAAEPIIATSSGQNDAGLFEMSLHEERWLPFEGQGAVSSWTLSLDARDNNFDLTSVTDVILHVRYTARVGGDADAVRATLKPGTSRSILISAANTFGAAFYAFLNPSDTAATQQVLSLPLTDALFPFSNLGEPQITGVGFILALTEPMPKSVASSLSGAKITASFDLGGAQSLSLVPAGGTAPGGRPVAAFSGSIASLPSPQTPASCNLTVQPATAPSALQTTVGGQTLLDAALISDAYVVITYALA